MPYPAWTAAVTVGLRTHRSNSILRCRAIACEYFLSVASLTAQIQNASRTHISTWNEHGLHHEMGERLHASSPIPCTMSTVPLSGVVKLQQDSSVCFLEWGITVHYLVVWWMDIHLEKMTNLQSKMKVWRKSGVVFQGLVLPPYNLFTQLSWAVFDGWLSWLWWLMLCCETCQLQCC